MLYKIRKLCDNGSRDKRKKEMDNTDIRILECLRKNARINASDIADKVNLSASTVSDRIRKLETSGIIRGYTVVLDPQKLNKDIMALITVAIEDPKFNEGFENAVKVNPDITECFYIAGSFDYLLKVITDNTKSLESVLNYIKGIAGVGKTVTNIVLNVCKNEHSVSVVSD